MKLLHYPELDSTNEEARRLLEKNEIQSFTIIRAESQTAGRGTHGRTWVSPKGAGLYFSIVHPFEEGASENILPGTGAPLTPLFTLAAGLACAQSLEELAGLKIGLKPINDLYVDGRKLGGILTESLVQDNRCRAVITGIGINLCEHADVRQALQDTDQSYGAISLQACMPPMLFDQWNQEALARELCMQLATAVDGRYKQLLAGEDQAILDGYMLYKIPALPFPAEWAHLLPQEDRV